MHLRNARGAAEHRLADVMLREGEAQTGAYSTITRQTVSDENGTGHLRTMGVAGSVL